MFSNNKSNNTPEVKNNNLNATSTSLIPSIPYDRAELLEMIQFFPENQEKLIKHLDEIEQLVSKIRASQNMMDMVDAVSSIEKHAKNIYTENQIYNPSLSNSLKNVILRWIKPIQTFLEKQTLKLDQNNAVELHGKKLTDEELILKKRHLYAEQSFIARQPELHRILIQHLQQLKKLFTENTSKTPPRCYIVYTAPTDENRSNEYWVVPFLSVLYEHLKVAGIDVLMDIKDIPIGGRPDRFREQYKNGSKIILIGTESLKDYFVKDEFNYSTEKSVISTLLNLENKNVIHPLLISGTSKTSFPEKFGYDSKIANAYDGYISTLKLLTDSLIGSEQTYDFLWKELIDTMKILPENNEAIIKEINEGYHKRSLDYLEVGVHCLCDESPIEMRDTETAKKTFSHVSPDLFNPNSPRNQAKDSVDPAVTAQDKVDHSLKLAK